MTVFYKTKDYGIPIINSESCAADTSPFSIAGSPTITGKGVLIKSNITMICGTGSIKTTNTLSDDVTSIIT